MKYLQGNPTLQPIGHSHRAPPMYSGREYLLNSLRLFFYPCFSSLWKRFRENIDKRSITRITMYPSKCSQKSAECLGSHNYIHTDTARFLKQFIQLIKNKLCLEIQPHTHIAQQVSLSPHLRSTPDVRTSRSVSKLQEPRWFTRLVCSMYQVDRQSIRGLP